LRARLDALKSAIDRTNASAGGSRERGGSGSEDSAAKGLATGMRVVTELVSAVLVGCGVGWLLDRWLGTKPFLLIAFLMVGFAAGFMNVYRLGRAPQRPGTKP
jgi:ATP synthase protein I